MTGLELVDLAIRIVLIAAVARTFTVAWRNR
jgi:hypothetical protein